MPSGANALTTYPFDSFCRCSQQHKCKSSRLLYQHMSHHFDIGRPRNHWYLQIDQVGNGEVYGTDSDRGMHIAQR